MSEGGQPSKWTRLSEFRVWFWIVLSLFLVIDVNRAPANQWTARVILTGIDTYQATVSSRLGAAGVHCRFEPTCSHYAEAVIRREGALGGGLRVLGRLARCGPWTPPGTVDPP